MRFFKLWCHNSALLLTNSLLIEVNDRATGQHTKRIEYYYS